MQKIINYLPFADEISLPSPESVFSIPFTNASIISLSFSIVGWTQIFNYYQQHSVFKLSVSTNIKSQLSNSTQKESSQLSNQTQKGNSLPIANQHQMIENHVPISTSNKSKYLYRPIETNPLNEEKKPLNESTSSKFVYQPPSEPKETIPVENKLHPLSENQPVSLNQHDISPKDFTQNRATKNKSKYKHDTKFIYRPE